MLKPTCSAVSINAARALNSVQSLHDTDFRVEAEASKDNEIV